jgi:dipeptidyl aminopeptidase/acylaminoacyl peptidase
MVCSAGLSDIGYVLYSRPFYRIHHGEKDDIVPISQSINMEKALREAGADEVRFTKYPDAAHDSWTPAYNNIEVLQWIFKKTTEGRRT